MGKQYNKVVKRRRRLDYLKRVKARGAAAPLTRKVSKPAKQSPASDAETKESPAKKAPAKKAAAKKAAKKVPAQKPAAASEPSAPAVDPQPVPPAAGAEEAPLTVESPGEA